MKNEPIFSWYPETGIAKCTIKAYNKEFSSISTCHPDDVDMMNENTGCEIAYIRATIKVLRYYRDTEIKPALGALKQLYYSMNRSKYFNPRSYETKMLLRQISQKQIDLETVKSMIKMKDNELTNLIKNKDEFYQKIRKNRKANNV